MATKAPKKLTKRATKDTVDRELIRLAGMSDELNLDELILDWVNPNVSDVDVRGAITGVTIERTIEGASTLEMTLHDPENYLFKGSRIWDPKATIGTKKRAGTPIEYDFYGSPVTPPTVRLRAMQVKLDGIVFRLVRVSRTGPAVTLTFEDRVIYWLRRKKGTLRLSRESVTRAQFILRLLREIKAERVPFVCPDLNVRQPIDRADKMTDAKKKVTTSKEDRGVSGSLTVKGVRATEEQRRIGQRVLAVADSLKASRKASIALMEACIVESEVKNLTHGHSTSVGVLQLLNIHGSVQKRMDVEWCVRLFLTKGFTGRGGAIKLAKSSMSAGQIAQAVQGSDYPTRYDEVRVEAEKWVDAYAGSGALVAESDASGGGTGYKSYMFARESNEDSWTCMQRLAEEVGWSCFMIGRSLYYMSEEDLFRRKTQYLIEPEDPAVLNLSYDLDMGKAVSSATLSVVAGRWKCPPGEPVLVEGFGPPDGRWLVVGWRRDYFSPVAEITLAQPGPEALEPPPQAEVETGDGDVSGDADSGATGLDESSRVMKAYRRAEAIDRKKQSYVWGGGHGSFNDPRGYDCSGFVSSILNAGGMMTGAPQATGTLQHWGQPGKGKYLTIWVKENGNAHQSHTFAVFTLKGSPRYAEAGGSQGGATGWHRPRSHAGFVARHWPGT